MPPTADSPSLLKARFLSTLLSTRLAEILAAAVAARCLHRAILSGKMSLGMGEGVPRRNLVREDVPRHGGRRPPARGKPRPSTRVDFDEVYQPDCVDLSLSLHRPRGLPPPKKPVRSVCYPHGTISRTPSCRIPGVASLRWLCRPPGIDGSIRHLTRFLECRGWQCSRLSRPRLCLRNG